MWQRTVCDVRLVNFEMSSFIVILYGSNISMKLKKGINKTRTTFNI